MFVIFSYDYSESTNESKELLRRVNYVLYTVMFLLLHPVSQSRKETQQLLQLYQQHENIGIKNSFIMRKDYFR